MTAVAPPEWFQPPHVSAQGMGAWRGVEAQHIVSTLRLVDTLDEQLVLEQLLEGSKPPVPLAGEGKHYLLFTPFRYNAPFPSRFRRAHDPGVWYGAQRVQTACAEVAWWRHRFVTDSEGLADRAVLTQHTFFQAQVHGPCLDLTAPPWSAERARWTDPHQYQATQDPAQAARGHCIGWLKYESVRAPGTHCAAVLDADAMVSVDLSTQQTWTCKASRHTVLMSNGREHLSWDF